MKVSFIGAGNVAWHLAQALEKAGHLVKEVYSRDLNNALELCKKLYQAKALIQLNLSESEAELFIITLADDAIEEVLKEIKLPSKAMLVHTSGSKSLEIFHFLNPEAYQFGVFYPLQTFSKNKALDFSSIPFCIEASDKETENLLIKLAKKLTNQVQIVNSEQRKVLHIAAVFACNFANHLFALSKDILEEKNLSFDLLKPLINETIDKALKTNPRTAQTGPAQRKDLRVIESHLSYLADKPEIREIYRLLSESILKD